MSWWHYFAAPFVLAFLGVVWHLSRGLWAPLPERVTGSVRGDLLVPLGFLLTDFIHDVEFDEDGYYRLDSIRNLKVAVGLTTFFGMLAVICMPGVGELMAFCLDWFVALIVLRWQQAWI